MAPLRPGAGPTGSTQNRRFVGGGGTGIRLNDLTDVTIPAVPPAGSVLISDGTGLFTPQEKPFHTKAEVAGLISELVSGLSHGVAVVGISNDPPATPTPDVFLIVGTAPTGAWVGHANEVATVNHEGQWIFTTPTKGDAHLIENEGAIFSWNGTLWVKVYQYSGPNLKTKVFTSHINDSPASPIVLDFGRNDWTTAKVSGNLEVRNAPTHMVFNLLAADNTPLLLAAGCAEACMTVVYSNAVASRSTKAAIMFSGDDYTLSWLGGPGYNNNDRMSATSHCYPSIEMKFQYFYDGYLVITNQISYKSYYGDWCSVSQTYAVNNTSRNAQKLIIKPRENARIAFNGIVSFE